MSTKSLEILIDEFNKLPGIGRKTAQRLAFYVMELKKEDVERFSKAMFDVKEKIKKCELCGNYSESDLCPICNDEERDKSIICVVEEAKDIISMEKAKAYNGVYHVLHGRISPLSGVAPDDLNLKSLMQRAASDYVKEVILALNPDLEGETTSLYLAKFLKSFGLKVTKIASGIPMGGNLEYADMATISRSMEGRREVE